MTVHWGRFLLGLLAVGVLAGAVSWCLAGSCEDRRAGASVGVTIGVIVGALGAVFVIVPWATS